MERVKRLELTPADLLGLRFAHSPMAELVTSTFALRDPQWHHARWHAGVHGTVRRARLDVLWTVLSTPAHIVPDFVSPVPQAARPTLDDELAAIAATPPGRVAAELAAAGVEVHDPTRLLPTLVTQLRRYFTIALAPRWPALRAAADAEIAHRTSAAAFPGPRTLLAGLHPRLRWDPDALHLDYLKDAEHPPWSLDGNPLALLPTAFSGPYPWIMDSTDGGRALWYPPRALGALFTAPEPPPHALAALLGATRAAVLTLLSTPASTGDVAERLALAPATASHHLTALRDAGLIVAARAGRRLNYRRTDLGDRLTTLG
jgi:DNA-binding transcriptional ArsR family regulator